MIDRPIMDLAIKVAESSLSKKKVGAVLLNKGRPVVHGVNKDRKTHPFQARLAEMVGLEEKIYLHAEISALVKCKSDADMYYESYYHLNNDDQYDDEDYVREDEVNQTKWQY